MPEPVSGRSGVLVGSDEIPEIVGLHRFGQVSVEARIAASGFDLLAIVSAECDDHNLMPFRQIADPF